MSSQKLQTPLDICGAAPSCWKMTEFIVMSCFLLSARRNLLCSMSMYLSIYVQLTITVCPASFSKKKGPIIPLRLIAHQVVTFATQAGCSIRLFTWSSAQDRMCCFFTWPPWLKWASSLNKMSSRKYWSSSIHWTIAVQNSNLFLLYILVWCCSLSILYVYRFRSSWMILPTVMQEVPTSCASQHVDSFWRSL